MRAIRIHARDDYVFDRALLCQREKWSIKFDVVTDIRTKLTHQNPTLYYIRAHELASLF